MKANNQTINQAQQRPVYQIQQQKPAYQNQQYRNQNPNRPNQYVWKGRVGQTQQTGFRFNRSTPTTYPPPAAAATTTQQPAAAPAAATTAAPAASTTVAYVETVDPAAQLLGAEGGEVIGVPVGQFYELMDRAGLEVDNDDIVGAISDLNFH